MHRALAAILVLLLAACSTPSRREPTTSGSGSASTSIAAPAPSSRYYKDDGPGDNPPPDLDSIPDAVPRVEPINRLASRPYTVFGREYVPATALKAYRERGIASWYGRKFHGQKTSIGETYDMYAMTAAHPTLPLPSYARVTNVANGKSVVVRVNDRGPFLHDRVIDLSYAAAYRLGIAQRGSGEVVVEAILPDATSQVATATPPASVATTPMVSRPTTTTPIASTPAAMTPVVATPADVEPVATTPTVAVPADVAPASKPAPAPTLPSSAAAGSYAVQLGAFASYPNALNFLAHVQNQLNGAQVEAKVRQSGGLYRVYVGPYAERDEARRVGERITQAFGFATMVAPQ